MGSNRQALVEFYQKHYVPNNATLVVVGDVVAQDAFNAAEKQFAISADASYKKETFNHTPDLGGGEVTLYREVQKPALIIGFVIPGLQARLDYVLDCLTWVLGAGKSSRLYKRIVEQENIASDVNCFVYDLFDSSVLFVQVDPYSSADEQRIKDIIIEEMAALAAGDIEQSELVRATKKTEMDFLSLQENNQKLAYIIGKYYTALQDSDYLENYLNFDIQSIKQHMQSIAQQYDGKRPGTAPSPGKSQTESGLYERLQRRCCRQGFSIEERDQLSGQAVRGAQTRANHPRQFG